MRYLLGGLIAALLLVPPAADAGFAILDEAGHQTLLSRGRLKITPKGAGGIVMFLDVGGARMWVADAGRRVHWEGTVEQYCQEMRGAMSGAMAEMEKRMAEQLKDMPPAQRDQTEQLMKQVSRGRAPARLPRRHAHRGVRDARPLSAASSARGGT